MTTHVDEKIFGNVMEVHLTGKLTREDYERVAAERYRFVVAPGHQDSTIEQVVERHETYVVVEKVGQAREQLDRDHPQQRHQS
jgi:hypothetical protein